MAYAGGICTVLTAGTPIGAAGIPAYPVAGHADSLAYSTGLLWDTNYPVTVFESGAPTSDTDMFFDYLFGRVRFSTGYEPVPPIAVNGHTIPLLQIATARSFDLSFDADLVDTTVFTGTASSHKRKAALMDVSFSIEALEFGGHDHDPGAGTQRFIDILKNGTLKVFEFNIDGASDDGEPSFRIASYLTKANIKSQVAGVVTCSVEGKVAAVREGADFSMLEYLQGGYT